MTPTAEPGSNGRTDWPEWFSEPLRRRDDVEVLPGLDDRPLLYDPRNRSYLSISPAGAAVFRRLDGRLTGHQVAAMAEAPGKEGGNHRREVIRFLLALRDARLLESAEATPARANLHRLVAHEHLLRLPLSRALPRMLEPACRAVERIPRRAGRCVLLIVGVLLAATIAAALGQTSTAWPGALWLLLLLQIPQAATHELAHAFMCQRYGVPVREAGIGLLFYVMPVAYVDRTDAYRLTERRQRVRVALAGPMSDLLWAGGYALVCLAAPGGAAQLGRWGLTLALIVVAANLNPLLPTDGFRALEAAFGSLDLRGRSLAMLVDRFTGTDRPAAAGRPALYLGLAVLWLVYVLAAVAAAAAQVLASISGARP